MGAYAAGTLVLTETGKEPIETITEGEAEIVEAAAQGAEIAIELNGQEYGSSLHHNRRASQDAGIGIFVLKKCPSLHDLRSCI